MEIGIALSFFIITFLLHIILHRYLLHKGKMYWSLLLMYIASGIVLFITLFIVKIESIVFTVPITAFFFYCTLVAYVILMYITPYLSTKAPSTIILESLNIKHSTSYAQLCTTLSEQEVVDKRLQDLLKLGFIVRNVQGEFILLPKGVVVFRLLRAYEFIFGWHIGG